MLVMRPRSPQSAYQTPVKEEAQGQQMPTAYLLQRPVAAFVVCCPSLKELHSFSALNLLLSVLRRFVSKKAFLAEHHFERRKAQSHPSAATKKWCTLHPTARLSPKLRGAKAYPVRQRHNTFYRWSSLEIT